MDRSSLGWPRLHKHSPEHRLCATLPFHPGSPGSAVERQCRKNPYTHNFMQSRKLGLKGHFKPSIPDRERSEQFPQSLSGKESVCNAGDEGSIPGSGRSPRGGHGNPLQYSSLENPMDSGAWWATIHGVVESDTTEATEHACKKGPQKR